MTGEGSATEAVPASNYMNIDPASAATPYARAWAEPSAARPMRSALRIVLCRTFSSLRRERTSLHLMRTRFVIVAAMLLAACAPPPETPEPIEYIDDRTPMKRLADSASLLVRIGVDQSDSASLRAQLASVERDTSRRRRWVGDARRSALTARESFTQAIEKGDRLRDYLKALPSTDDAPKNYVRYWTNSRYRLDVARTKSHTAILMADSLLGCSVTACGATAAASLKENLIAAAGSAHEAHSLLRIAMSYIR